MTQTLRFMDSFDHYQDASTSDHTMITSKWTTLVQDNNYLAIGAWGRNSTNGFKIAGGGGVRTTLSLTIPGGAQQDLVAGFAFFYTGLGQGHIFQFKDTGSSQIGITLQTSTKLLELRRGPSIGGGSFGTLLATGTRVLQPSTWYYIEVALHVHGSTGTATVRVNEGVDISFTGNTQGTANATANIMAFGDNDLGVDVRLDDVYVATGGTAFYGDCRVEAIFPQSDGAHADFTPSTGVLHYALVDEVSPPNEDTDYNKSLTVGHKDSYVYSDPSPTSATMKGVQFVPRMRTDDEGTRTMGSFYRSPGANEYNSPNSLSLTSAYSIPIGDIMETNPETGVAWTLQEIKDAEFGVRVIS